MTPLRHLARALLPLALLAAAAAPALADDVGVTAARLIELADGGYALEADVSPLLVGALRPPVLPERFTPAARPSYRRVGVGLVVRYEFGGSDRGLEAGDVLLLPWARSAVLLTARWRDGEVHRAMFPRTPAGIRVPIETLRPIERSPAAIARLHLGVGLAGGAILLRLLLACGIVAAAGGGRAVRLALAFTGGHALAMVAIDLDLPTLPPGVSVLALGLGAALLARSGLRGDGARLGPLILAVGIADGLGIAGALSGPGADEIVPALFGALVGIDAVMIVATIALAGLGGVVRGPRISGATAAMVGSIAVAVLIAAVAAGARADRDAGIDTADRMAAARLDFAPVAGVGTATGGRRAAAPRRLDNPAMIFLTVEPREVRVEILLGLGSFLEPLRIAGGPGSVLSPEVQAAIAARARRMAVDALDLSLDGREAVPILERTDFVTVAATGVATRDDLEPVPLESAVLGVTLVYGAERPPAEIVARWRAFPSPDSSVPAVWTDPTGSERMILTPEQPTLRWANDLASFEPTPVRPLAVRAPSWPLVSLLLGALAALAWIGPLRRRGLHRLGWAALVVAIALYPFVRHPVSLLGIGGWAPARAEAADVVDGLLTGVYRSFDVRDEEAIYDRLAVSVTGERLTELYLESRRALELQDRGGARARVDQVEVHEVRSVRRDGAGGFRVEATWTVSGSVNHFGHVHYRQNRYDAALHLIAVEGAWKLRDVEILDERRVL